jgi:DMSO/TMAO reductase YedYZ heme-binding membrane subunit
MQKSLLEQIFGFAIKNRNRIIGWFKFVYIGMLIFWLIGARSIYYQDNWIAFFYNIGRSAGKLTIIWYVLTLIPGIARRFGIQHRLVQLIMLFRRYLGILTYLTVFIHLTFIFLIPNLKNLTYLFPIPLFELFGIFAVVGLSAMFLTSNDWSVGHLKKWWQRIHNVTYIVMWFILFHVFLQQSRWSLLIGLFVLLEMGSFVADYIRKHQSQPLQ